ncbi:PD-(D/E)XK nuclease family protein [Achromobacter xylosoxidans]
MDLIERVKISDDFLDVVSLTETQHSDMLAWCLHPNEGHGQGDAVIKDFLIAAYDAGQETNEDSNKAFFAAWTPAKVRTSSFGSAFIAREFSLATSEAKKGRLDLFLIDPSNKIIVTIENKAGASLTEKQLSDYYSYCLTADRQPRSIHGVSICLYRRRPRPSRLPGRSPQIAWQQVGTARLQLARNVSQPCPATSGAQQRGSSIAHGVLPEANGMAKSE